jgi:hypothetical protein
MNNNSGGAAAATIGLFFILFELAIIAVIAIPIIVGTWKVFTKAGKPGWAAIIPFYRSYVLTEVIGKPIWWFILLIIPCTAFIMWIFTAIEVAKKFGQGMGFAVGLIFLPFIFFPILGFGSAQYNASA